MKTEKHKKFAALDAAALMLAVTAIIAVCVRIIIGDDGLFSKETFVSGTYTVTLIPTEKQSDDVAFYDTSDNAETAEALPDSPVSETEAPEGLALSLRNGHEAYLSSGEILGTIEDVQPDSVTVRASGIMTDRGFLLNGTFYLAPNMNFEVRSLGKTVSVTVTDITLQS